MYPVSEVLQNIADYTSKLKDKAKSYDKIFVKTYPEINAFSMIHNGLVLPLELLDYYYNKWDKAKKISLDDQYAQRIKAICKWTYIDTFSIIEYISKELIKKKNCKEFNQIVNHLKNGKRVGFYKIIQISNKIGLIEKNEMAIWDDLREIRNAIVHNNSIVDKDGLLEYTFVKKKRERKFKLPYKRGQPITGNLHLGLILVEIITERYYQWVQKVIQLD